MVERAKVQIHVVVMKDRTLYDVLVDKYKALLADLQIGYSLNDSRIACLWNLIQTIDCLEHTSFSTRELKKIVNNYYE